MPSTALIRIASRIEVFVLRIPPPRNPTLFQLISIPSPPLSTYFRLPQASLPRSHPIPFQPCPILVVAVHTVHLFMKISTRVSKITIPIGFSPRISPNPTLESKITRSLSSCFLPHYVPGLPEGPRPPPTLISQRTALALIFN